MRGPAPVLLVPSDGTGSAAPGESAAALVASSLPPGKETPLPPRGRGVGGRSARKAPNSSAGTAQVRRSAAAAAGAALWAKCGTAARRSRAGSEPSGAPS